MDTDNTTAEHDDAFEFAVVAVGREAAVVVTSAASAALVAANSRIAAVAAAVVVDAVGDEPSKTLCLH